MLPIAAGLISIALYASAATRLIAALRREDGPRNPMAVALASAGALLHAVVLYDGIFVPGGLDLGFFNALSLSAWAIVVLMLALTLAQPVVNLGIGLFPLAAIGLAGNLAFGTTGGPTIPVESGGLDIHVLVSMAAYAVLSVAAMQAILLGVQHRMLHEHHPVRVVHTLPPLYVMEGLLFRLIATGFGLLTLALITGFAYLDNMFAQDLVHKTVLTMIAWGVFGVLLGGHYIAGWRGPTAVRFTLGGLALLVLGYFGSKLVLELVLAPA
ncbi:MAG: cytochrome c biogenesis protein CcsA [Halofilum sp. (in: g-proteobacteria)]